MTDLAAELDRKLQKLDPATAASVERVVRSILRLAEQKTGGTSTWPKNFWQSIRADWGEEPFERPPQGDFEKREDW